MFTTPTAGGWKWKVFLVLIIFSALDPVLKAVQGQPSQIEFVSLIAFAGVIGILMKKSWGFTVATIWCCVFIASALLLGISMGLSMGEMTESFPVTFFGKVYSLEPAKAAAFTIGLSLAMAALGWWMLRVVGANRPAPTASSEEA